VAGITAGKHPAARRCLFAGNIGVLRLGSGARDWSLPAEGTIVEEHQGEIVEQRAVGTFFRSPTVAMPPYVVLEPSEVGPGAG
jgi:hypothetical protein